MAITSIGYDGSVNEAQWAKMIPLVGSSNYGVAGSGDFKVTPHATMDRGVNIATGSAWGYGVLDTSDATISLQGNTVSSGTRWDLVVVRRNWSGTGGSTTVVLVQGTASRALPSRNTTPGTIDDQPIALVQFTAGQSAPTAIVDLRCWSRNGGLTARDDLALAYLKEPGASIMINGTQWNCELDANGNSVWTTFRGGYIPLYGVGSAAMGNAVGVSTFLIQAGSQVTRTDASSYARIVWPKPFPNGLLTVVLTDGDDWTDGGSAIFAPAGGSFWGQEGLGDTYNLVYAMKVQPASAFGTGSTILSRNGAGNRLHRVNWIAIGW